MTHITTDDEEGPILDLLFSLGIESAWILSGEELHAPESYVVFLNGGIVGIILDHIKLITSFRTLRRQGVFSGYISIYLDRKQKGIYISSDGGRLCRPYIVCEDGKPLLTTEDMEDLKAGLICYNDLVDDGIIEFLDVNEENDSFIALYEKDVQPDAAHLDIEPFRRLGACAGLVPYPHHNQSPRNTYQCAMGKQAMGTIGLNQKNRIDTLMYNLVYPHRPMVKTRTMDLIHFDE